MSDDYNSLHCLSLFHTCQTPATDMEDYFRTALIVVHIICGDSRQCDRRDSNTERIFNLARAALRSRLLQKFFFGATGTTLGLRHNEL